MSYHVIGIALDDVVSRDTEAILVRSPQPVVFITPNETFGGFEVVREISKVGVTVRLTSHSEHESERLAEKYATQYLANIAIKRGGNAIIRLKRGKVYCLPDYGRDSSLHDCSYRVTYTGMVAIASTVPL